MTEVHNARAPCAGEGQGRRMKRGFPVFMQDGTLSGRDFELAPGPDVGLRIAIAFAISNLHSTASYGCDDDQYDEQLYTIERVAEAFKHHVHNIEHYGEAFDSVVLGIPQNANGQPLYSSPPGPTYWDLIGYGMCCSSSWNEFFSKCGLTNHPPPLLAWVAAGFLFLEDALDAIDAKDFAGVGVAVAFCHRCETEARACIIEQHGMEAFRDLRRLHATQAALASSKSRKETTEDRYAEIRVRARDYLDRGLSIGNTASLLERAYAQTSDPVSRRTIMRAIGDPKRK